MFYYVRQSVLCQILFLEKVWWGLSENLHGLLSSIRILCASLCAE